MELQFLGRGAAFYPQEGNTAAYMIEQGKLLLIDCGELVFKKLLEDKILDSISEIYLFITHTHSDHVGSMGTLVLYSYFVKKKPANIIIDGTVRYLPAIYSLLEYFGVTKNMFNMINPSELDGLFSSFIWVRYIETEHCDELQACGILFHTSKGLVYYSGDTKDLTPTLNIIRSGQPIYKIYIDSTTADFPGNPHLCLRILDETIPRKFRSRVFCMHINDALCIQQALDLGFNVVELAQP
jgi:ribonuclease BN (tRNA processing enzyme)